MKTKFISLFLVLASLVSCEKVTTYTHKDNTKESITFSVNAEKNTKAIVTGNSLLSGTYFGVYGYVKQNANVNNNTSGAFFMNNAKYNYDGTVAVGSYYWPKSDNNTDLNFNFVAVYPYDDSEPNSYSLNANNQLVVNVTANGNNEDLLYAVVSDLQHQVVATYNNTSASHYSVPLTFRHALSLIEFRGRIKASNNIESVNIQKIEFLSATDGTAAGIKTTNTLTFDIPNITTNTATSDPLYTPTPGTAGTVKNDFVFAENVSLSKTTDISTPKVLDDVILVPQAVPAYIRITFDITIANTTGETIVYKGRTVTKQINTGSDMTDPTSVLYITPWASGHKYIYDFTISAEGVDFTVTVGNWSNGGDWNVWDHNTTAYVEHFFDKASTMQGQRMVDRMALNSLMA